jgi:hypothetical protein
MTPTVHRTAVEVSSKNALGGIGLSSRRDECRPTCTTDQEGTCPVALKKSDLYASLWASCDELRGGMDASHYKDYVLTLLFVKYVSDRAAADPNRLIEVPRDGSFAAMEAAKGSAEIGDQCNKIIALLAKANDLTNVIDLADFNDEEKLAHLGAEFHPDERHLVTEILPGDRLLDISFRKVGKHVAGDLLSELGGRDVPKHPVPGRFAECHGATPVMRREPSVG